MVSMRRCWRAVTRSSKLQRVAGQWYVVGFRVAMAITSSRAEGGKAPRATRARCILQATQALGEIATAPTANRMAVTVQLLGYLQIGRVRWRRRAEDHLTTKGQGLGGGGCTGNRFQTRLFLASQDHVGSKWRRHRPVPYKTRKVSTTTFAWLPWYTVAELKDTGSGFTKWTSSLRIGAPPQCRLT